MSANLLPELDALFVPALPLPSLPNGLALWYQPIVDVRTGRVCVAEALLRRVLPLGGICTPTPWLSEVAAQGTGLALLCWLLQQSARAHALLATHGVRMEIHLNVCAAEVLHPQFVPLMAHASGYMRAAGWPMPHLELVESTALPDVDAVAAAMHACLEYGVGFSLDDFGTAYSSLEHLYRLPAQVVKVDRQFVSGPRAGDSQRLRFVEALIDFLHASGKTVVCEGVNSVDFGESLCRVGSDRLQGYAIAKPMSLLELKEWVLATHVEDLWWNRYQRTPCQ